MSISDWIRPAVKKRNPAVITATPATPATPKPETGGNNPAVATVATVAVVTPRKQKTNALVDLAIVRGKQHQELIKSGKAPEAYNREAECIYCGPVWSLVPGKLLHGCPWCDNREKGRYIPRPEGTRCGDCRHFQRTDHGRLGHCAAGCIEPPAGLWDTDPRYCGSYLNNESAGGCIYD